MLLCLPVIRITLSLSGEHLWRKRPVFAVIIIPNSSLSFAMDFFYLTKVQLRLRSLNCQHHSNAGEAFAGIFCIFFHGASAASKSSMKFLVVQSSTATEFTKGSLNEK